MENNSDEKPSVNETETPQVVSSTPATPPLFEPATVPPVKPKSNKKLFLIIALIAIIFLAIGATAAYFLTKKDSNNSSQQTDQSTETKTDSEEIEAVDNNPELARFLKPETKEVWLDARKEIPSKGWLTNESSEYPQPTKYYEIGSNGENKIIVTVIEELGENVYFFELSPDEKVSLIKDVSANIVTEIPDEKFYYSQFSDKVEVDMETHYDSLSFPKDGIQLKTGYKLNAPAYNNYGSIYEPEATTTESQELKSYAGNMVKYETTYEEPGLQKIWFSFKTKFGFAIELNYKPLDLSGKDVTWQTGDKEVSESYSAIVRGCGFGSGVSKAFRVQDSDLKLVGKTNDGKEIYETVDLNYKLLTKVVEEYNEFYSNTDGYQAMTKQTMTTKHGLVFFKDSVGNWLAYTRNGLAPDGGCAKPVVYLYPESTQSVNVKVGADVKISDPFYDNKTGWLDVLAQPSGKLFYQGKEYGSLFWEGPGWGKYPGITTGLIVPTTDAISTIHTQLQAMGINETEIKDFVEYWQDKLPNKPYTRLTWLQTSELNQLAPLYISPEPDTLIRVFLDYSGLDEPYSLPAQNLQYTKRNGFTVVEWGGLSPFKLY